MLVGEVDFLPYQFSAFVRLAKSVVLGDLTEVPVPTRFIFIILGPTGNIGKYREIGRSISTLLTDDVIKYEIFNIFKLIVFLYLGVSR